MKTLSQLKEEKKVFNDNIWKEYNALRKECRLKIDAAEKAHDKAIKKAESKFISKAIRKAGDPELSDQLILDRVEFDPYRKILVVIPEAHGVIPPRIKPFHAQAMLRSGEYTEHLLFLAELFIGESFKQPDSDELDNLRDEFCSIDRFKRVLQGKEYLEPLDESRSSPGSPIMTMIEMREYIERTYPDRDVERMSVKEAMEIMAKQTRQEAVSV